MLPGATSKACTATGTPWKVDLQRAAGQRPDVRAAASDEDHVPAGSGEMGGERRTHATCPEHSDPSRHARHPSQSPVAARRPATDS